MHDEMQPLEPNLSPEMGQDQSAAMPTDGPVDNEGAMAKADLYKLANYSFKLFKKLDESQQLESWVQAKITKAADYIASVYHYLEYEMEFSEYGKKLDNSDVLSESQKAELKNKLMEAKEKIKALKVSQAKKVEEKTKVKEGTIFGGGEQPCTECGGTGMVMVPEREVPEAVKEKVKKYNRQAKAFHAASKRIDKNKNGIPDDEEIEEDQSDLKKTGDSYKTSAGGTVTKTSTGVKHERDPNSYDDGGDDLDTLAKSGKGIKSHAKSKSASEKKAEAPKLKKSKSGTWGMEGGEKFDTRKKEKAVDETYGQGIYEGEAPSAGMTKKEKSAVVKKAKKGEDIGKPGKGFEKVEKAAKKSGAKDPKAVAAAAMWKNAKKKVAENIEQVTQPEGDAELGEGNITDQQYMDALNKLRSTPEGQAKLKAAMNSSDPNALNNLVGFKMSPGEKATPAISDPEGVPAKRLKSAVYPSRNAGLNESADLDRLKQFLTRLNG